MDNAMSLWDVLSSFVDTLTGHMALTACLLAGICAACAPTASPGGAAPAESPAQSQTQPGGDAAHAIHINIHKDYGKGL